ncbi:hypothetical protein LEP1GSC016_2860 [Leptospira borgpetersenii serovar Hardjo-bovis str. Sponselee]|uniref:Uncharacterized protein n=1 Tax=Leptospira borgpetersenii serovar Hardjo-bovis str. Sponselee TaxID=1303729 RepID=M6C2E1_LEPBO|nr:hypothetical protein LEP1GSC016_2860 [Leptospira borgpetersenii serovar Hardjo-bovis str. Sponselee]
MEKLNTFSLNSSFRVSAAAIEEMRKNGIKTLKKKFFRKTPLYV